MSFYSPYIYTLDWLDCKSFTTLFVDGNHENFDRLNAYPVAIWNGGKVHKVRDSVIHLIISGGILEPNDPDFKQKMKVLDKGWRPYRINHVSWWKEELPTEDEMEEGRRNLAAYGNSVDFIVTHCCSSSTQILLGVNRNVEIKDRSTTVREYGRSRKKEICQICKGSKCGIQSEELCAGKHGKSGRISGEFL